jgi:preprotein translocase subunit SecA
MRVFGGEKISSLMGRFNMPEDVPLTHPLVSRVIEQIQVKVEGYNFDARKNLVEYDDVINKQRKIVYQLRDAALLNQKENPEKNKETIFKNIETQVNLILSLNTSYETGKIDFEKVILEFSEILPLDPRQRSEFKKQLEKADNPQEFLLKLLTDQWQQRVDYFGNDLANSVLTYSIISTIDPLWVDHLTALDDLRDGVRLRGYAQKDPLIEYRKEGYEMFQKLMSQFEYNLVRKLFRLEPVTDPNLIPKNITEGRGDSMSENSKEEDVELPPKQVTIQNAQVIGRNDPCPCGSGKKYKKCCYPKFG